MTNTIQFELVSPEAKLVSEPVYMAVIPGDEGMFGVMRGHSALVASLKPGIVKMYKTEGGDVTRIFISGGFADVSGETCTILAEEAMRLQDLNRETLKKDQSHLIDDLSMAAEKADKERIKGKIEVIKAKLKAIESL